MELTARIYTIYTETLSSILNAAGASPLNRAGLYAVAQNSVEMIGPSFLPVLFACAKLNPAPRDNNAGPPDGSPLEHLSRAWIKTVLADTRVHLLVPRDILDRVRRDLEHIPPLFETRDLDTFRSSGGDPVHDPTYSKLMQTLVHAQQNRQIVRMQYRGAQDRLPGCYQPLRFEYTASTDRFHVQIQRIESGSVISVLTIGMTDIIEARLTRGSGSPSETASEPSTSTSNSNSNSTQQTLFDEYLLLPPQEPLILEITGGRDVLDRCQYALAAFEKRIEYDQVSRTYTCWLPYKSRDEDNLITQLLDLDPSVRVLSPPHIARKVRANQLQRQELRIYRLY